MDNLFITGTLFFIFVAFGAYQLGRSTATHPSEDEMLARLIRMRTARKMETVTEETLNAEVNASARRVVDKTAGGRS